MPANKPSNTEKPPTSPKADPELKISALEASSNGIVSFNVTLYECDSGLIESVVINGSNYSWSAGTLENTTILRDQTKHWSKNVGRLIPGEKIEVTVKATPVEGSKTTAVEKAPAPNVPDNPSSPNYLYDYYSGVGLFERGIHVIATSENPLTQLQRSDLPKSYWTLMQENTTNQASDQDFISILISRGDKSTGGYTLQVESSSWLESHPVKLRLQVNFTDPGEDLIVTQAFTNPLAVIPIGHLSQGEYEIEVHIVGYILTYDAQGKPNYRPIMTFKEEVWTQTLRIV